MWSSSLSRACEVDGRVPLGEVFAVEATVLKSRPSMFGHDRTGGEGVAIGECGAGAEGGSGGSR